MNKLYRLTHFYNIDNQDVYFISNEEPQTIFKKAAYIQFRAETIVSEEISLNTRELANFLFKSIEVIEMPFKENVKALKIDMYLLREAFCPDAFLLEKEMRSAFNLKVLDKEIKETDNAINILKSK